MRGLRLLTGLLLAVVMVEGCASVSDSPSLYAGMSRDRVKACFGEPLRIEAARSGGEDWYYAFKSWRNADIDGSAYSDGVSSSGWVSVTVSDQGNTRECPVHLSAEGYVIEPVPTGKVVRN